MSAGNFGLDERPVDGECRGAGFQDDVGRAAPGAMDVQSPAADIDQRTGRDARVIGLCRESRGKQAGREDEKGRFLSAESSNSFFPFIKNAKISSENRFPFPRLS